MRNRCVRWIGAGAALCLVASMALWSSAASGAANVRSAARPVGHVKYVKGGTYRFAEASDPGNLFPYQTVSQSAVTFFAFTYDTLVNFDLKGQVVSGLADKWHGSPTKATFTLRKGITCADGGTLTAGDVAKDFDYVLNPKNASPWLGLAVPASGVTVSADNATRTVTVKDKTPFSFLMPSAGTFLPIVCPAELANPAKFAHAADGTGPYKLTSASPGTQYVLKVRKGYDWGPEGATTKPVGLPKKIIIPIVSDETTETNLLLKGQLNTIELAGPNRSRVVHVPGVGLFKIPVAFNWLFFNQRPGHIERDKVVREALTMAVNLHTLERVATGGLGSAATELVPSKTNPCQYNSVNKVFPRSDLKKARGLLTKDGWVLSHGVRMKHGQALDITLLDATDEGASVEAANEYLQKQWDALGAKVTLKGVDTDGLIGTILSSAGAWDASQVGIGVNLPSQLVGFLSGPVPTAGTNFAGINNTTYNKDVAAAERTSGSAGCKLWKSAEKSLFRSYNLVPFATNPIYVALKGATARESVGLSAVAPLSVRLIKSS